MHLNIKTKQKKFNVVAVEFKKYAGKGSYSYQ